MGGHANGELQAHAHFLPAAEHMPSGSNAICLLLNCAGLQPCSQRLVDLTATQNIFFKEKIVTKMYCA